MLFEGSHGRGAAARGDTLPGRDFRCPLFKRPYAHILSLEFVTANPVACAAAKANLDLWKDQECHRRIAAVATMQEQAIEAFRADPRFANVRRSGTITALDLKTRDTRYLAGIGPRLHAFFKDRNLLLRPLGNTIYVMPPYCVTAGDLDEI